MSQQIEINPDRLWRRIEELSQITERDRPWTRRSFTPKFMEGRKWLEAGFAEAGLSTHIDAGGNLIGRREGQCAAAPTIAIGSHSDTVPSGGRFDGILGVIAGLEIAQSLHERNIVLSHPLEIIDFLAEEPSEFGLSCIGSRAICGQLTAEMLTRTRPDGITLAEALRQVGGQPDALETALRPPGSVRAYLELHIEQGRVLEAGEIQIGVVSDIAGIRRDRLIVSGRSDHAGATPMSLRHDALVGAAAIIQNVWNEASNWPDKARPLVATIGQIEITPNAANAVPGEATMMLEVRSGDPNAPQQFVAQLQSQSTESLALLGVSLERQPVSDVPPAPCHPDLQIAIKQAADELGFSSHSMPSGAGHDGVFISQVAPIGMIFVPCKDGRSHAPEEWLDPHQAADGARVLARTLGIIDMSN